MAASSVLSLFSAAVFVIGTMNVVNSAKFDELFQPSWAEDHLIYEGELVKLRLDSNSGAGFASKNKYLFGKVTVNMKLVDGDSAGTVTAFYMSSDGPKHNEFDFEFLGNTTGEPYLVQTNVYVNGDGNREQRLQLWFDPTKEFHSYSILWTERHIVFRVDETPVRVHVNMESHGLAYPKNQPMGVYSSIWNADDWATQGGLIKTNWAHSPFIASYKNFEISGCECPKTSQQVECSKKCCSSSSSKFWWNEHGVSELSLHERNQLIWVRANHMVYDYCNDNARFHVKPVECLHHQHTHH